MEFFGGEALILTKFFRVDPYSSGVNPNFMEVFRGECNFSQSSGIRRKGKSSTGGEVGGEGYKDIKLMHAQWPNGK